MSHLSTIYSPFVDLMEDSTGLFDSPHASMGPHVRKGVKEYDIHIKPKSYKLKLLGELVF